ncbi:carbon starvation protein A [candidate division WOR-3 bacterium]|nr:carbon starvation protein A [candidate division WOR-3 bacterium]
MDVILLVIVCFFSFFLAYKFYGTFIAKRIFAVSDERKTPANEFKDGIDYVPTRKEIIFGHHFASIAGTGPIVGPAIGIIWGWVPAIIWIVLGTITIGAVHDFGSLILSIRNEGKSISEITGKYINKRTQMAFFAIVFLELLIVIAIFGLIMAIIFSMFPESIFPMWFQIPIAVWLGWVIYKKNGNLALFSIIAVALMYLTIVIGVKLPITLPGIGFIPATGVWTIILLIYAYMASMLPVTTLLQPRDYINSHQLIVALFLLFVGVFTSAFRSVNFHIVAPAINFAPKGAPPVVPFIFITIACGAVSGFHSLVSSGTSAKQLARETDGQMIGYGAMVMEAILATLVLIAVAAGIGIAYESGDGKLLTGIPAWTAHYSSWAAAEGLGSKISAFVIGAANMITSSGIPKSVAIAIMGVFVVSFAGTTLDTATRIQRYVLSELFGKFKIFQNRQFATAIAVITAGLLAFATGASGKGALKLWPMFGATNQTLAALALLLITIWLKRKGGIRFLVSGIPCVFMALITTWALVMNQISFIHVKDPLLLTLNMIILFLNLWIIVEGTIVVLKKVK